MTFEIGSGFGEPGGTNHTTKNSKEYPHPPSGCCQIIVDRII